MVSNIYINGLQKPTIFYNYKTVNAILNLLS